MQSKKAFCKYDEKTLGLNTLPVVTLGGTPYDMGRFLGSMFAAEIVFKLEEKWRNYLDLIQKQALDEGEIQETLIKVVARQKPFIPKEIKEEIEGFKEGIREVIPQFENKEAFYYWLAINDLNERRCIQIVAEPPSTQKGIFHFRQKDLISSLNFHSHPIVIIRHPQTRGGEEKEIPFAEVSFLGEIGTSTGMNREGVSISQVACPQNDELFFRGTPLNILMRLLLQKAKTKEEAALLLKKSERTTSECFALSDPHSKDPASLLVLSSPNHFSMTPNLDLSKNKDPLFQTYKKLNGINYWADVFKPIGECQDKELALAKREAVNFQDNSLRLTNQELYEVLCGLYGHLTPETLFMIGDIFSHSQTIFSALFDLKNKELFVSFAKGSSSSPKEPVYHIKLDPYFKKH